MDILLATTNLHKAEELRAILGRSRVTLYTLDQLNLSIEAPTEDQDTFESNAELKARHYAEASGLLCLAEDSGLEVDALGGAPGVYSARYSGETGGRDIVDPANNAKLLRELGDAPPERRAGRFVCAMAMLRPGEAKPVVTVHGTMEGRILRADEAADPNRPEAGRGHNGFGYDPLFVVHGQGEKTSAELAPDHKNALSHRGDAARRLVEALQAKALL